MHDGCDVVPGICGVRYLEKLTLFVVYVPDAAMLGSAQAEC